MGLPGEVHDIVIVGGGLMGAASAWSLARRGRSVLLVEQFAAGHAHGSSHGSARIVRRAYADVTYTRLAGRAFELWRDLELSSGKTIVRMLGALDYGPARAVHAISENLTKCAVPHEVLPAREAARRWPGMRFAGDVLFHAQAGTMDASLAVETLLSQARSAGAQVRHSTGVRSITLEGEFARVQFTDDSWVRAAHVVVAAGAWVQSLVGTLAPLPALVVSEQQIFHFPRLDPATPPWPSVIHMDQAEVYHLAGGGDGGPGEDRKVGLHDHHVLTTASGRAGLIDPAVRARVVEYVSHWLPGLEATPRNEATCLYTLTPSENFVLDRVGALVICSPCSGHGAKFAPLIGELVADLVAGTGVQGTGVPGTEVHDTEVPPQFRLRAHASAAPASVSL